MKIDSPLDFPLHRTRVACMQDVMQRVARGYHYHHTGTVPISKAVRLVAHLDRKHNVLAGENERSLLKRYGHPAAVVLLDYDRSGKSSALDFVLLATAPLEGEKMTDARLCGLTWRGMYRLHPKQRLGKRQGTEALTSGRRVSWTWSMTALVYEQWEAGLLLKASWRTPDALNATLQALANVPNFAGIRSQKKRLVRAAKARWVRAHGSQRRDEPEWPEQIPWVRRVRYYDDPPSTVITVKRQLNRRQRESS